jgi:hypothetical protein
MLKNNQIHIKGAYTHDFIQNYLTDKSTNKSSKGSTCTNTPRQILHYFQTNSISHSLRFRKYKGKLNFTSYNSSNFIFSPHMQNNYQPHK